MMIMAEQNVEYQILVQFNDDLTQLIQHNVVSMSSKLFAKGLVPKDVHDSSITSVDTNQLKAAKLLLCVLDKIKGSAGRYFQDFIDILRDDSYFEDVVLKIIKRHSKHLPTMMRMPEYSILKISSFSYSETLLDESQGTFCHIDSKQIEQLPAKPSIPPTV